LEKNFDNIILFFIYHVILIHHWQSLFIQSWFQGHSVGWGSRVT